MEQGFHGTLLVSKVVEPVSQLLRSHQSTQAVAWTHSKFLCYPALSGQLGIFRFHLPPLGTCLVHKKN